MTMGHLAAAYSKANKDVSETLLRMLDPCLSGRGDALGVATEKGVIIENALDKLEATSAPMMLGYNNTRIEPADPLQPLSQHGYSFVFEGRLWHDFQPSGISTAADTIGRDPDRGIQRLINERRGSYAVAALDGGAIHCGRDTMGVVPLYFGENSEITAIATCKKMLWTANLEAKTFPPGYSAMITDVGISFDLNRTLDLTSPRMISMDDAVDQLDRLLIGAVETRRRGLFRVPLGFSGGIDSSLLAHYLDKAGAEVDLLCVGMEGSREFATAEAAADSLDLPLRMESFTLEDVEADMDSVLWAIEEPDPMKTAVAIPLYWAARIAPTSGVRVFFSGNGSDELFGGYRKYAQRYIERGEAVREDMFRDVAASHEVNYERDWKVCAEHGMELRLPFADLGLVEFGLSLPMELKLSPALESPRKLVLRRLAEKLGFPEEMAYKPKRAIQYSTGVNNALKRLARREAKSLAGFLIDRFEELKEERLGR
jgi:asparagine synthase (glutamine-hydrolysing)